MIADWRGAGLAIRGKSDSLGWYEQNKNKMRLDESTRVNLEYILNCPEYSTKYFIRSTM